MKPSYDNADKHRADVEQPSKVALSGTFIEKKAHFGNVVVTDLGLVGRLGHEAQSHGMPSVIVMAYPLKIADGVVGFDAINMIDGGEIKRVRYEGQGDKPMDQKPSTVGLRAERNSKVLSCMGVTRSARFDELSLSSEYSPILVNRSSVNASNSSERTYFVKAAETDGCDWPPFFANIHFHPHRTVMSSYKTGITVNQGV